MLSSSVFSFVSSWRDTYTSFRSSSFSNVLPISWVSLVYTTSGISCLEDTSTVGLYISQLSLVVPTTLLQTSLEDSQASSSVEETIYTRWIFSSTGYPNVVR